MLPAFAFDFKSKKEMCKLIENGYCYTLLAGKTLATYNLEVEYLLSFRTIYFYIKENAPNWHYNHLDLINYIRYYVSINQFCEGEKMSHRIMHNL